MIDFKPRRQLKLKPNTPMSDLFSNSGVRFVVAGFFSVLVTLLLFIFMNYLIGNFDKYAQTITENLFSLHMTRLDKNAGVEAKTGTPTQGFQLPPKPPEQPQTQANDKPITNAQRRQMMIEALLGKREASDNTGGKDKHASSPE